MFFFVCIFLLFNLLLLSGQQPVYFSYANPELNFQLNTGPHYAGSGVSTYDYNEDGWDDLTICISGSATLLYTNNKTLKQNNVCGLIWRRTETMIYLLPGGLVHPNYGVRI